MNLYCRWRVSAIVLLTTLSQVVLAEEHANGHPWLLVSNAAADTVSYIDPRRGVISGLQVGKAPFGIATDDRGRAYVATAEGVVVLDIASRTRLALIPYTAEIGPPGFGEYRKGGMGIDVSADGRFIYAGVYLGEQVNQIEVIDSLRGEVIASYPIGKRPFDVLLSADGRFVYSVDHDSYSITRVDLTSGTTNQIEVAPLGYGAFDKPHYGVFDGKGRLFLPVQGQALVVLDPVNENSEVYPLSADTHQHGVAITSDGSRLVIVGTGAAGGARQGPSLTLYDLHTNEETLLPLARTHEEVALSKDGRYAYLTGGQSFTGGWNGLSVVDLETTQTRFIEVPDQPLGIVTIPVQDREG